MELTGHEKKLDQYTKDELVKIADRYKVYWTTASGQGSLSNYNRLSRNQLISLISNDNDYKRAGDWTKGNRFLKLRKSLIGTEKPTDLMNEILDLAKDTERVFPIPNKYYTYIYYAATRGIKYDRHPLVKVTTILPTGFIGFNFHWTKYRRYNSAEGDRLVSALYELNSQEVQTLRSIPYALKLWN